MDRWTRSQEQASEPARSVPAPRPLLRPETTHLTPPSLASLKLFLPWLSPRKDTGEQPWGGVIEGSRLPLKTTNSYPPLPPVQIRPHSKICDLPTTCTRWAGPMPGGAHSQAKAGRGQLPGRSPRRQTCVYRPPSGPGKGPPGKQSPASCPHNAAPMEPERRVVWGLHPPFLGPPSLRCPHSTHRHTCSCTHTQSHTHARMCTTHTAPDTHTQARDTHTCSHGQLHFHVHTVHTLTPQGHTCL